jgi:hypothetical protein
MIVSQNQACCCRGGGEGIFKQMRQLVQRRRFGIVLPVAAMALALGGCGSMDRLSEFVPNTSGLTTFEWNPYSSASMSVSPKFQRPAATPADYVNGDGSCGGGSAGGGGGAVALQMTECAVVQILGAPEKVDIGSNERGERAVKLLYSRGERAGLYSFIAGYLTQIERVAEPAPPARPQKPPPKPARRSVG